MTFLIRSLTFILGFAAFLGVLFLIANTYGWEKIWVNAFGPADMGAIQFEDFAKGPKPNQSLICPDGICDNSSLDSISPVYQFSVSKLQSELLNSLEQERNLERVDDGSDPMNLRFVQRTRRLRFPDTIRVRFFALSENQSTIALHSQSQIGNNDFGVNKQRLIRWLGRLKEFEVE